MLKVSNAVLERSETLPGHIKLAVYPVDVIGCLLSGVSQRAVGQAKRQQTCHKEIDVAAKPAFGKPLCSHG